MIQQTETAIIEALEDAFPGYAVGPYQRTPQQYEFTHPRAAIVPVFQQASYGESAFAGGGQRAAFPEFNIATFTHGLHPSGASQPRAYELLEAVAAALEGLLVEPAPGAGAYASPLALRIQRTFFIAVRPGPVWIYGQDYQLSEV